MSKHQLFDREMIGMEINDAGIGKTLSGKIALVTGASSGLGARFAAVLAAQGATVVLASRRLDRLKSLKAEIEAAGGRAAVVAMDVTDVENLQGVVDRIELEVGPIDILVNNSGVSKAARLVDVTPADFDFMMGTNLRGAFFVAQAVANRMLARAKARPEKTHRIINIASVAGLRVLSQIGVYCMSKAAVVQMTKAMALEWSRFNINVNAICPGYITTDMNASHWETEAGQKMMAMLPRRRVGKPEDLDALLLLLAGDGSDFINGAIITADDGLSVT
jgi:NAD(P)-dependent dehydrogenase (short-subunit alcohol dehydrogenase family)